MVNRLRRANQQLETSDKVLLFVTALVGFLAITLVVGMFAAAFWGPENLDLTPIIELISNSFLMLTGAIVGYIGGQGVAKAHQSEQYNPHVEPPVEPPVEEKPDEH